MEMSMKQCDPSIQVLAKKNTQASGQHHPCHRGGEEMCPLPLHIDLANLFSLDIDNNIWQDIGLTESEESTEPPPWLCDEEVWKSKQCLNKIIATKREKG